MLLTVQFPYLFASVRTKYSCSSTRSRLQTVSWRTMVARVRGPYDRCALCAHRVRFQAGTKKKSLGRRRSTLKPFRFEPQTTTPRSNNAPGALAFGRKVAPLPLVHILSKEQREHTCAVRFQFSLRLFVLLLPS